MLMEGRSESIKENKIPDFFNWINLFLPTRRVSLARQMIVKVNEAIYGIFSKT